MMPEYVGAIISLKHRTQSGMFDECEKIGSKQARHPASYVGNGLFNIIVHMYVLHVDGSNANKLHIEL